MTTTTPDKPASVPMKAFLFTDKLVLAQAIALALNHGRFVSRNTAKPVEALAWIREWNPNVIVFDLESGNLAKFVMDARAVTPAPVIGLTRETLVGVRLEAFDEGVDDILTLPFFPEELLARVVAVLRRAYRLSLELDPVQALGDLKVDILKRTVQSAEHVIQLTALEMSLLYLLASAGRRALTRDEIVDNLWGSNYLADSNVVDRHIRNLRVKLRNGYRNPKYIMTKRGVGYSFIGGDAAGGGR